MKKITRNSLYLLFFCLCIMGCEQEEFTVEDIASPTELELAESYLSQIRSLVVFAALHVNHEEFSVQGYLVDKHATLRKVNVRNNLAKELGQAYISDNTLRQLHAESEEVELLSVIETAEAVKLANRLSKKDLATQNNAAQTSTLYVAFQRNTEHERTGSCGPGTYDNGPTYLQLLIAAQGHLEGANSRADVTPELLDWLKALEAAGDRG